MDVCAWGPTETPENTYEHHLHFNSWLRLLKDRKYAVKTPAKAWIEVGGDRTQEYRLKYSI